MGFKDIDKEALRKLADAGASVTVPASLLLELLEIIERLEAEVAELKKNSRNSSKPPSSDRANPNKPPKDKTRRGKRRRPGGQRGHGGRTLQRVANPDKVITHGLHGPCKNCGAGLRGTRVEGYEARQVFDLPEVIRTEVTEHRAALGRCRCCGKKIKANFPKDVTAPVQYGERTRALVVYLHVYQLLPCERLGELCADVFGCPLSPGTVANILEGGGPRAGPPAEKIKEQVRAAPWMLAHAVQDNVRKPPDNAHV